jgi:copper(I)-binding protein
MCTQAATKSFALGLLALVGLVVITACGASGPEIRVEGAWVRPDPLMENAAGYLVIHNDGAEADYLTGVRVDFVEDASVHETVMQDDMHGMRPVERLEIPAGGRAELRPLSYHVMLVGLKEDLPFGETVSFVLEFEISGDVAIEVEVRRE